MDKEKVKAIVEFISTTDLDYVQIEKDGKKFLVRRALTLAEPQVPVEQEQLVEQVPELCAVRSPIVGRFYSSLSASTPALVVEGGKVSAGRKVAIVEAMGIKKEVYSPFTGKVIRIHVRDGDAVEYGQELFSVEESDGESN